MTEKEWNKLTKREIIHIVNWMITEDLERQVIRQLTFSGRKNRCSECRRIGEKIQAIQKKKKGGRKQ